MRDSKENLLRSVLPLNIATKPLWPFSKNIAPNSPIQIKSQNREVPLARRPNQVALVNNNYFPLCHKSAPSLAHLTVNLNFVVLHKPYLVPTTTDMTRGAVFVLFCKNALPLYALLAPGLPSCPFPHHLVMISILLIIAFSSILWDTSLARGSHKPFENISSLTLCIVSMYMLPHPYPIVRVVLEVLMIARLEVHWRLYKDKNICFWQNKQRNVLQTILTWPPGDWRELIG